MSRRRPLSAMAFGLVAMFAVLSLPVAAAAQAQVPFSSLAVDRSAPVEIESETLDVDQEAGTALFSGEVLVVQDGLRLVADRLLVFYGPDPATGRNRIQRMRATGNVLLVTPDDAAEADSAIYDLEAGELTMEGDVLLTQGPNALAGDRLDIDLETGLGRMEGRVRSVILPGTLE